MLGHPDDLMSVDTEDHLVPTRQIDDEFQLLAGRMHQLDSHIALDLGNFSAEEIATQEIEAQHVERSNQIFVDLRHESRRLSSPVCRQTAGGRLYRFLPLCPSKDLFICAKDLFVEAKALTGPGTKTFEMDQSFEPGARNRRP